ncbi:MAG TPA: hypothetical protein VGK79_09780 [Gaiellaceae bacterium]
MGTAMQGTSRSDLAVELERCARLCEDTAERYVDEHGERVGADVVSALMLAAAAMDTAAGADDHGGPVRDTALLITATLAVDAIDAAERHGLDEGLLLCVASLRRVSARCEAAIRC